MDEDNASTTDRIITAATQLFSENGYMRTTTKAIATAAEVNEVTIFRQFGSKKQLFMACIEAFNNAGFARTFAQNLSGDYATDIMTMAQTQLADSLTNFKGVRLLVCESSEIPEIQAILEQATSQNMAAIAAYFQRQIDAGVVRPGLDADWLAQAFDNLFSSYLFLSAVTDDPQPPPAAMVQQLVDIFVTGTINEGRI
ncbi:MAG: TetR/AcrR family transcriptional regulator [Ardenticatenaceae bacterium]|nr:TetR/AcrR family transcriptional regulator [Ardenticatenaceae bacterium]